MNNLKLKILEFLHGWLNENKITQIRKNMPEDLENFIVTLQANQDAQKMAERAMAKVEEALNETNS